MDYGGGNPILPIQIDNSVRFSTIGGLKEHIRCLREMVLFPLMYPELFRKFNTRPAKGVLFHGPPGTGKTLLARALANECCLVGGRKVSFFMRKGADVMNRYYGESERNLRMVFQQASKMKPSIIFFDEVDALAPIRSTREGQTHASVVATLLAEMDGLCDRGEVIVIGATNRPDAMDPAVRRAGRFDRELYFPPPELDARKEILQIHTKYWQPPLTESTLDHIARATTGYLGADIKILCSEAVLKAVRRVYPQIYETEYKLLVDAKNVEVTEKDIIAAMEEVLPSGYRSCALVARSLPPHCIPLLQAQVDSAMTLLRRAFPPPGKKSSGIFLVCGECAETHIAPALLAQLDHYLVKELNVATLHAAQYRSPEQAVISVFNECRRSDREYVVFVPNLLNIWNMTESRQSAVVLQQLWKSRPSGDKTLLLATCPSYDKLPRELQEMFPQYKDCIYSVRGPTASEVKSFLRPIMTELPLVPPIIYKNEPLPQLPRAPLNPNESPEEMERRRRREFEQLQLMKVALRSVCKTLSSDRRYQKFNVPVNLEVARDYLTVISHPMDLQTLLTKIEMRECRCGKEFLDDIDLICTNALQYKLDKHATERKNRQDVYSLHTEAYSLIAEEVDPELELQCQITARKRRESGFNDDFEYDDFIYFAKLDGNSRLPRLLRDSDRHRRKSTDNSDSDRYRRSRKRRCELRIRDDDDVKRPRIDTCKSCPKIDDRSKQQSNVKDQKSKMIKELDIKQDHKGIMSCTKDKPYNPFDDVTQVSINKAELDVLLNTNIDKLRGIGLEALIELHAQLSHVVHAYASTSDRTRLPTELGTIVSRYLKLACK